MKAGCFSRLKTARATLFAFMMGRVVATLTNRQRKYSSRKSTSVRRTVKGGIRLAKSVILDATSRAGPKMPPAKVT